MRLRPPKLLLDADSQSCHVTLAVRAVMWHWQSELSCDTSSRSCHVTLAVRAVMWHWQSEQSLDTGSQSSHVTLAVRAIMWRSQSELSLDTGSQSCHVTLAVRADMRHCRSELPCDTGGQSCHVTLAVIGVIQAAIQHWQSVLPNVTYIIEMIELLNKNNYLRSSFTAYDLWFKNVIRQAALKKYCCTAQFLCCTLRLQPFPFFQNLFRFICAHLFYLSL